jgi:hypothetical protein
MSKGWIVDSQQIVLTIGFGTHGFLDRESGNGSNPSFADALYKAIALLAIQTGATRTASMWQLELARKRYASKFVRSISRISALAEYAIVIDEPILRRPR